MTNQLSRALHHFASGHWPSGRQVGSVTLTFDDRHRRRMRMTADDGIDFLLDLPRAVAMNDGDGLELQDGNFLRVTAAAEDLMEVSVTGGLEEFGRIAWHLGNRHLPVQIVGNTIRLRRDHVIEAMLRGLGASVHDVHTAFQPEGGAYSGGGHNHHHDHDHDDDHHHDHSHTHSHGQEHSHGHGHRHD